MDITISTENDIVTAVLSGRLDTLSASKFEQDIAGLRQCPVKRIVLDCKGLEYISSSGLRVFLSLLKDVRANGGTLTLINVNSEIRNIFTITGFHKIFAIED